MKRILVSCGTGVATSTLAVHKVKTLCEENGIEHSIMQCSYHDIRNYVDSADIVVTTQKFDSDFGKPTFFAFAYITGVGEAELNGRLLEALRA